MKIKKQYFAFTPVMVLALYSAVLGFVIPNIQESFSLSFAQAGLLSTMQSIGMVVALILCFSVFAAFNKAKMIFIVMLGLAAFLVLLGLNRFVVLLYVIFFFFGVGKSLPDTLANALIADLSEKRTGFYISLLHALWAATGALGPFFAMAAGGNYKSAFIWLGVCTAAVAFVFWYGFRTDIKKPMMEDRSKMGSFGKLINILKRPGMKLFVVTSFLCSCIQVPVMFFITGYAESLRGVATDGAFVLSAFFVGWLIGCVIYAKISHFVSIYKLLLVTNIAGLLVFGTLLLLSNVFVVTVFAMLLGLCISSSLPIVFAEACDTAKDDTAAASALVLSGVALAYFAAAPIVGAIADATSLRLAFFVDVGVFLPIIVLAVVLLKRFRKKTDA